MGYFQSNNPKPLPSGDTEFGGPALGMPSEGSRDAATAARAMRRAGIAGKNDARFSEPLPPGYDS